MEGIAPFGIASGYVRDDHVFRRAANGFPADAETLAGKLPHSPVDKGHHLDGGLTGPDSSITDQGVVLGVGERQYAFLFLTYRHIPT